MNIRDAVKRLEEKLVAAGVPLPITPPGHIRVRMSDLVRAAEAAGVNLDFLKG